MNDRVGLHPLHLRGVEVLNLPGGEALERHALLPEPGQNRGAEHPFVGAVGGDGDGAPGDLQPPLQVVRKQLVRGCGGIRRGNLEGLALFREEGFGLLFVVLHEVACKNPFCLAFFRHTGDSTSVGLTKGYYFGEREVGNIKRSYKTK